MIYKCIVHVILTGIHKFCSHNSKRFISKHDKIPVRGLSNVMQIVSSSSNMWMPTVSSSSQHDMIWHILKRQDEDNNGGWQASVRVVRFTRTLPYRRQSTCHRRNGTSWNRNCSGAGSPCTRECRPSSAGWSRLRSSWTWPPLEVHWRRPRSSWGWRSSES